MNALLIKIESQLIKDNIILDEFSSIIEKNKINIEIDENNDITNIYLYTDKEKWNQLKDFAKEWKLAKDFFITKWIFNDKNYLTFFSVITQENNESENEKVVDLDKYIYKVPENDEKVNDILNQINNLKRKK